VLSTKYTCSYCVIVRLWEPQRSVIYTWFNKVKNKHILLPIQTIIFTYILVVSDLCQKGDGGFNIIYKRETRRLLWRNSLDISSLECLTLVTAYLLNQSVGCR